ncbi:uncharacterized protein LOC101735755 isoform X2 [Bombyx mori]|nr:uncharacterized protein LOC101735755 isoform X2 [Bombyx mori]
MPLALAHQSITLSLPFRLQLHSRTTQEALNLEEDSSDSNMLNSFQINNFDDDEPSWDPPDMPPTHSYETPQQHVVTSTIVSGQFEIDESQAALAHHSAMDHCGFLPKPEKQPDLQDENFKMDTDDQSAHSYTLDSSSENSTPKFDGGNVTSGTGSEQELSAPPICLRSVLESRRCGQVVKQITNKVVRHARFNKVLREQDLWCIDCKLMPVLPVTGKCGHTRCTKCIKGNGHCPCGEPQPENLHVNTLIQELTAKILLHNKTLGYDSPRFSHMPTPSTSTDSRVNKSYVLWRKSKRNRHILKALLNSSLKTKDRKISFSPSILIPLQIRYQFARKLFTMGRYRDAAPHLAHIAASSESYARQARVLLTQAIAVLIQNRNGRRLTRVLFRAVRKEAASSWLKSSDINCVLCCSTLVDPVTTPCGHTYCRTCVERSMDYNIKCALCLRPLNDFDLSTTGGTIFIRAMLASVGALRPPPPPDPNVMPIFICTVAYPSIPCPLFIFDPRYRLMVRRVLESETRKFGMVACERNGGGSEYGTILQVCDCIHMEDGRSILSTVGVSRFRVLETGVRDGYDIARVQVITDLIPEDSIQICDLRVTAVHICYKALSWLNSMHETVYSEIVSAFGNMPQMDETWWRTPDGPAWLWWLIAILPLRTEIKVLILSTRCLMKRLTAVSRTLEAIDQIAATTEAHFGFRRSLNHTEHWVQRG